MLLVIMLNRSRFGHRLKLGLDPGLWTLDPGLWTLDCACVCVGGGGGGGGSSRMMQVICQTCLLKTSKLESFYT